MCIVLFVVCNHVTRQPQWMTIEFYNCTIEFFLEEFTRK